MKKTFEIEDLNDAEEFTAEDIRQDLQDAWGNGDIRVREVPDQSALLEDAAIYLKELREYYLDKSDFKVHATINGWLARYEASKKETA